MQPKLIVPWDGVLGDFLPCLAQDLVIVQEMRLVPLRYPRRARLHHASLCLLLQICCVRHVVDDDSEQLAPVQRLRRRDDAHVHGLVLAGAVGRVDACRHLGSEVHEIALRDAFVH